MVDSINAEVRVLDGLIAVGAGKLKKGPVFEKARLWSI